MNFWKYVKYTLKNIYKLENLIPPPFDQLNTFGHGNSACLAMIIWKTSESGSDIDGQLAPTRRYPSQTPGHACWTHRYCAEQFSPHQERKATTRNLRRTLPACTIEPNKAVVKLDLLQIIPPEYCTTLSFAIDTAELL